MTFHIDCQEKNSAKIIQKSVASSPRGDPSTTTRRQVVIEHLRPATEHVISVRGVNRFGTGPPSEALTVTTPEAPPSAPPLNLECVTVSADAVQVTWAPPAPAYHNGHLQGFRIFYRLGGAGDAADAFRTQSKRVGGGGDVAVLHALQPFQNYSIQIAALNRAGSGPLSASVTCQTDENGTFYFGLFILSLIFFYFIFIFLNYLFFFY